MRDQSAVGNAVHAVILEAMTSRAVRGVLGQKQVEALRRERVLYSPVEERHYHSVFAHSRLTNCRTCDN